MLDAYIKVTAGTARWLLFTGLMFIGPVVTIVARLMMIFGLLAFAVGGIWELISLGSDDPGIYKAHIIFFTGLFVGFAGTALMMSYNMHTDRMYLDRMYPDEEEDDADGASWWRTGLNWLAVLALFCGFCVAAYLFFDLKGIPMMKDGVAVGRSMNGTAGIQAVLVGFLWFMAVGTLLGIARWFYRRGGKAVGVVADKLHSTKTTALARIAAFRLNSKKPSLKVVETSGNVVQLRRRA